MTEKQNQAGAARPAAGAAPEAGVAGAFGAARGSQATGTTSMTAGNAAATGTMASESAMGASAAPRFADPGVTAPSGYAPDEKGPGKAGSRTTLTAGTEGVSKSE